MIQIPTFKSPLWPQICVCKERSQINQQGSGAMARHIWATQSTPRHIDNGKSFPSPPVVTETLVTLISILTRPGLHWPGAIGSDSRSSDREIVIQVRSRPWPSRLTHGIRVTQAVSQANAPAPAFLASRVPLLTTLATSPLRETIATSYSQSILGH